MDYLRVTEPDGSKWVNAEAFDDILAALRNCVNYWPSALNDDLQEQTFESARLIVEEIDQSAAIAEEEAALIAKDYRQQDDLREQVAAVLTDLRANIYLATIRQIVIEELNKLTPHAGEPTWQTKTPVPIPGLG